MKNHITSAILFILIVSACSPAPISAPNPTHTPFVITKEVAVVVTATQLPATSTPSPTLTPPNTATPSFIKWNNNQVIQALNNAGLEIVDPKPMVKADYGIAPMSAIEGTHFLVPSVCSDCGGRIFSFATQDDLGLMQKYFVLLGKQSAVLFSWVFVKDNILIQINGDLPDSKAKSYQTTLDNLK